MSTTTNNRKDNTTLNQLTMSTTTNNRKDNTTLNQLTLQHANKRSIQEGTPSSCGSISEQPSEYGLIITFKVDDQYEASILGQLKPFDWDEEVSKPVRTLSDCSEEYIIDHYIMHFIKYFDTKYEYSICQQEIKKIFKGPFTCDYINYPKTNTNECYLNYNSMQ
jgi:hypothetical protein